MATTTFIIHAEHAEHILIISTDKPLRNAKHVILASDKGWLFGKFYLVAVFEWQHILPAQIELRIGFFIPGILSEISKAVTSTSL
jgi:hypothetical protein